MITIERKDGRYGVLWFVRWRGRVEPIAFTRRADALAFADVLSGL